MGLMAQLFGSQPQGQGGQAPAMGLIQNILANRQPVDPGGVGIALGNTLATGRPQSPADLIMNRIQPMLEAGKVIGGIQQNALELAKLNDMINFHQQSLAQNPNALPITSQPTTPQAAGYGQNQPKIQPQNASGNMTPAGTPDNAPVNYAGTPAQPDFVTQITNPQSDAQNNQPTQQPQQNTGLTPLYKGNEPYTDGLEKGFQWAQDAQGNKRAIQIPGTIQKGNNGEVLTSDNQGNITQQIPVNPMMRQKFEQNIQQIADKFNQLHQLQGTVETGGNFLNNKGNQIMSTGIGQVVNEGNQTQALRAEIQNLIKQTTPLYMQAMGITPGMERAVSAQKMLQDALGGAVGQSRQQNMSSIANLSRQAGTGQFAQKYSIISAAQDALSKGANQQAVYQRLQQNGIDPRELQ